MLESELAEENRREEDKGAEALIKKYRAETLAETLASPARSFVGIFNPPRDGDCLMQCAVEHDFGTSHGCGGGQRAPL